MRKQIWLVALVTALCVVCGCVMSSCNTLREEAIRATQRVLMPANLQQTNAEIDQQEKEIDALQKSREAFAAGAEARGLSDTKFVKNELAKADREIDAADAYLSRLVSWRSSLEAELVQKTVDGEPLPENEPAPGPQSKVETRDETAEVPMTTGAPVLDTLNSEDVLNGDWIVPNAGMITFHSTGMDATYFMDPMDQAEVVAWYIGTLEPVKLV